MPKELTHDYLVSRAEKWLKGFACYPGPSLRPRHYSDGVFKEKAGPLPPRLIKVGCAVVFTEIVTMASETPDAIGFYHGGNNSILIECKTSKSDYYADRSKPFRVNPKRGVGDWRWYMTPKGMITPRMKLPAGWGLLEVCGKVVRIKELPTQMEKDVRSEVNLLWSAVRRLQIKTRQGKPDKFQDGTRSETGKIGRKLPPLREGKTK